MFAKKRRLSLNDNSPERMEWALAVGSGRDAEEAPLKRWLVRTETSGLELELQKARLALFTHYCFYGDRVKALSLFYDLGGTNAPVELSILLADGLQQVEAPDLALEVIRAASETLGFDAKLGRRCAALIALKTRELWLIDATTDGSRTRQVIDELDALSECCNFQDFEVLNAIYTLFPAWSPMYQSAFLELVWRAATAAVRNRDGGGVDVKELGALIAQFIGRNDTE